MSLLDICCKAPSQLHRWLYCLHISVASNGSQWFLHSIQCTHFQCAPPEPIAPGKNALKIMLHILKHYMSMKCRDGSSPHKTCYQHPAAYPDVGRGCQPSQKGQNDRGSSRPTTPENNGHLLWDTRQEMQLIDHKGC